MASGFDGALRVLSGGKTDPATITGRRIAVGGGKGGVGKSTVAVNLAIAYAHAGCKTLVVDSDLGMADLNLLLGVAPRRTVLDALGGMPVDDVIVATHGIDLVPALNGSYLLATLGPSSHKKLAELVAGVAGRYDAMIVDVASGIGQMQTTFANAVSDTLVVITPEPLSIAAAYASIKVLATEHRVGHAYIVPNRVASPAQADELTARLGALVARFFDFELTALPSIPVDPTVNEAAALGIPLLVYAPASPAARAIRQLPHALQLQGVR